MRQYVAIIKITIQAESAKEARMVIAEGIELDTHPDFEAEVLDISAYTHKQWAKRKGKP